MKQTLSNVIHYSKFSLNIFEMSPMMSSCGLNFFIAFGRTQEAHTQFIGCLCFEQFEVLPWICHSAIMYPHELYLCSTYKDQPLSMFLYHFSHQKG